MAKAKGKSGVRVIVIGDRGSGKSSLILAVASDSDSSPENVPPVLPPMTLLKDTYPDHVPVTMVDTSSSDSEEDSGRLIEELEKADAIVLTYACNDPQGFTRITDFWIPKLSQLEVKLPTILVGCKLDLSLDDHQTNIKDFMNPIMEQCPQIETCLQCSAKEQVQILEVFYYAQKSVLHPLNPVFDQEFQTLKPRCYKALKRIFTICDQDKDGVLNDKELNDYQKDQVATIWEILRKFGYNNELRLDDEFISSPFKQSPDQDNSLEPAEVDDLFSTAPENPWKDAPYRNAVERTESGGLSLNAFLSSWTLLTLLEPACSVESLICIGYPNHPSSAIRVTRRRRQDCKKQQSDRNVFQCFVFGPTKAGKSTLLNTYLDRPFSDSYTPTTDDRYATNTVTCPGGALKTLVLREISKDDVLSTKECLAACDVALFVHDRALGSCSSNEKSWKEAIELLNKVARHGESTGYKVPCLMVAAKSDLDSFPTPIEDATKDMGIGAPIPIKIKSGNINDIYRKIVNAAAHPHLCIPTTERGGILGEYNFVNPPLTFAAAGAAVTIAGLAVYLICSRRKKPLVPPKLSDALLELETARDYSDILSK
ncbi:hypothetical protein ACFE04_006866 [Oxalis oulophora]